MTSYKGPYHYIWQAFCALVKHEPQTAEAAKAKLKALFPFEDVDTIIAQEGKREKDPKAQARGRKGYEALQKGKDYGR